MQAHSKDYGYKGDLAEVFQQATEEIHAICQEIHEILGPEVEYVKEWYRKKNRPLPTYSRELPTKKLPTGDQLPQRSQQPSPSGV